MWNSLDLEQDKNTTLRIPPGARIQAGPPGVYPWADECKRQVQELGTNAIAYRKSQQPILRRLPVTQELLISIARNLREMAKSAPVQVSEFRARRTWCGADLD